MATDAQPSFWQLLPLYVGGLMGPLGTIVILPMFPELRESFDASTRAVSWGFSIYLLPFAALLLVSGTLGERWGRRRTVRITYLLYAAASVLAAVAPNLGVFLLARALQGSANAFITPLLVAGLAELTPSERLGRSVGIYSSFQAFGGGLAPIVGGVAADSNWRLAFVGTAVVAVLLAMAPPVGEPRPGAAAPSMRPLLTRPMLTLGIGAFAAAAGPIGISVVVGVAARDDLNVSGTAAGLILLCGAASAMLCGPLWGRLLDRLGPRMAGVGAATAVTASASLLAFGDRPLTLALLWTVTGALVGFVVVVFQSVAATVIPDNRGGALSFVLAFRFLGHGVGPLVWVAVFEFNVDAAFLGAAGLGLVTIAAFHLALPAGRAPSAGGGAQVLPRGDGLPRTR